MGRSRPHVELEYKSRRITDGIHNTAGFVQQASNVGMIILGVYLIADGELTMGGLIAATMLSNRAIGPMVQLSLLSTRYNQAKSSLSIIEQIMAMPDEQEEGKRYIHRPIVKGKIELIRSLSTIRTLLCFNSRSKSHHKPG